MTAVSVFLLHGALGTALAPLIAWRRGHRRREWLIAGLALGILAVPLALSLDGRTDGRQDSGATSG